MYRRMDTAILVSCFFIYLGISVCNAQERGPINEELRNARSTPPSKMTYVCLPISIIPVKSLEKKETRFGARDSIANIPTWIGVVDMDNLDPKIQALFNKLAWSREYWLHREQSATLKSQFLERDVMVSMITGESRTGEVIIRGTDKKLLDDNLRIRRAESAQNPPKTKSVIKRDGVRAPNPCN